MTLIATKNYEGEIIKLEILYDTYECPHNSNVKEIESIVLRDWKDFKDLLITFFKKSNLTFKAEIVGEETSFIWKVLEQEPSIKNIKKDKIKNIKNWLENLKKK